MALTAAALGETQLAFDAVAATYDGANRANPLIEAMRERTMDALLCRVTSGSRLLDLGCGPGQDAVALAERGFSVTAIDWSNAMVQQTEARAARHCVSTTVETRHLGIHDLAALRGCEFDAAYSNLGPLNCVPDLTRTARDLAAVLKPGGLLVVSAIGRYCPWELARYGLAGQWRRATIRFRPNFVPVPLEGRRVWTRYYDPAEFDRTFADAGFSRVSRRALGLLTPPPYLEGFASRHARMVRWLQELEDRIATWPVFNRMGDHFLTVLVRR